jgi:hypothetical protein
MEITRVEIREALVVEDVRCDRCDASLKGHIGNINGVVVQGSGAYDSTHFPDMHSFRADVCEKCCSEWFESFKRNPLDLKDEDE